MEAAMSNKLGYIVIAVSVIAAALLATAITGHRYGHGGFAAASPAAKTITVRIVYLAADNSSVTSLHGNTVILRIGRNGVSLERILELAKHNDTLIVIDLRNLDKHYMGFIRHVFREIVLHEAMPVILVGSPSEIEHAVMGSAKTYAIPFYTAKSHGLRSITPTEIKTLVFAYIPATRTRPWPVIAVSVSSHRPVLVHELYTVIDRVASYGSPKQARSNWPGVTPLAQLDLTYDCRPYGEISAKDTLYEVIDNDTPYKWLIYRFIDQVVSGEKLWNSGWRIYELVQELNAGIDPAGFLSEYKPTSLIGSKTVAVSIGITVANKSIAAWSYQKNGTEVIDESDYSRNMARWRNRFSRINAAESAQLEPGALIRYPRDGAEHFLGVLYAGKWAKKDCRLLGHVCGWVHSSYCILFVEWVIASS